MMKILVWLFRILLFVALFGLAIKNDRVVELRFYFDNAWQVPLSLVVLLAFAAGAAVGLTGALTTLARQWRELGQMRARLKQDGKDGA
ncbi:MAG: LapA family protein [Sterolibacteriaceae bacterium MAG5]|nr:LapA family protein [Candidatus Nitricoxidireducens bremensis]